MKFFFVCISSRKERSFGVDFCFIYKILEGKYELYFCCLGIFRQTARNDKKHIVGKSRVVVFFSLHLDFESVVVSS